MRHLIAAAAILAISLPARAEPGARNTTISVSGAGETLGDGVSGWREKALRVRRDFAPRTLAELGVSSTRRFGLADTQVSGAAVWPMGAKWTASVDASYSRTHRILPRNAFGTTLQYEFRRGWLLRGGGKTTRYDEARVNQAALAVEHYFKDYGVTVSWLPTHVFGVTANSYAVQGVWYYGERDAVSLTLATGREANNVGGGVVLGQVHSAGIGGRHMLSQGWSANYGANYTKQGDLYTRKGLNLGLAYSY